MDPTKNKTEACDLMGTAATALISISAVGSVLPSVGGIVSRHVPRTVTAWSGTPGRHESGAGATWEWLGGHDTSHRAKQSNRMS